MVTVIGIVILAAALIAWQMGMFKKKCKCEKCNDSNCKCGDNKCGDSCVCHDDAAPSIYMNGHSKNITVVPTEEPCVAEDCCQVEEPIREEIAPEPKVEEAPKEEEPKKEEPKKEIKKAEPKKASPKKKAPKKKKKK